MITATEVRAKRAAAGISGEAVCRVAGFSRSKLCNIECENVSATREELFRIEAAIDQIIRNRQRVTQLANDAGVSLIGVQL
jgi:transcriptional regulator with XRE-family HTH domain